MVTPKLLLVFMTVIGILLGPVGHLSALPTLEGGCPETCPCESESESVQTDELEAKQLDLEAGDSDRCPDDCQECECDFAVPTAIAPANIPFRATRVLQDASRTNRALTPRLGGDIFVPPIA